jgi:phosphatidylglycerophosphatase A
MPISVPGSAWPCASSRWTGTTWSASAPPSPSRARLTPLDHAARWIATAGGLGYAPIPGTVTSLPVALLVWALAPTDAWLLGVAAAVSAVGIWAAGREEARVGTLDPSSVVVDEVAGMLLACYGHPRTLPWVLGLFLLFRLFDVWKPLGIRALQALPGGFGIVVDDLLAGAYASLVGHLRHLV